MIEVNCDYCGGKIKVKPYRAKKGNVYCNRKCWRKDKRKHKKTKCKYCGKEFLPDGRERKFCCRKCYLKYQKENNRVTKVCVGCGEKFSIKSCYEDRYNYCSLECKRENKQGEYRECENCGKEFWVKQYDINRGLNRRHCSEECRRPPQINTCKNCGDEFRTVPSNNQDFCCFSCYRKYQGETSIEKKVKKTLNKLNINYKQEYGIDNWSLDFALLNYKIAIEADGSYWHSDREIKERDKKRDNELLNKYNWKTIRLKEKTINKSDNLSGIVLQRINNLIKGEIKVKQLALF